MDWSLLRSWVRGSKRSLTIDGHLSKCWVFLTLQCLYRELEWLRGWPDAYFLRLYKKKSPEALHSGCLLEAPRVAVMATVDQGSCTLIVLGRGALRQTARLYQFRQCKKARKPNIWETECWKYFPLGEDNTSSCRTPPRHTFSKGYTVSAKREEKGPALPSLGWGQAGPRLPDSLLRFYTRQWLKPVLDTAHVRLLANRHVLSLSSEHKSAGSTWASPQLWSLPGLLWEQQGLGGGRRSSSPMGIILPHVKAISISHVEGARCNADGLRLTHITRVNLCRFAF